jgi:hypothetical protein
MENRYGFLLNHLYFTYLFATHRHLIEEMLWRGT